MSDDHRSALIGMIRRDAGGAFVCGLGYLGDRLGLFAPLAADRLTAETLAERTGTHPRYVLEWAKALASFGYLSHDPEQGTFWLSDAQSEVLVQEDSPFFAAGTFQFAGASLLHTEQLVRVFREGGGIAYGNLHSDIPTSIDRMHRPWFDHLLTGSWIPDLPEVEERLRSGIRVLDVGCGLGRSTAAMAAAYPVSSFLGVDPHGESLRAARELARARSLSNASFHESTVEELPLEPAFDLAVAMDCIHDMRDPVGTLSAIGARLAPDGLLLWSEPTGSANALENTEPLARLRAALSVYHCLTVSLADGGPGLGTLLGVERARELATEAGLAFELLPVQSETQLFFGLRRLDAGTEATRSS